MHVQYTISQNRKVMQYFTILQYTVLLLIVKIFVVKTHLQFLICVYNRVKGIVHLVNMMKKKLNEFIDIKEYFQRDIFI